jgi:hypothetical protein
VRQGPLESPEASDVRVIGFLSVLEPHGAGELSGPVRGPSVAGAAGKSRTADRLGRPSANECPQTTRAAVEPLPSAG